jgi:hypothetical protein
MSVRSVDVSSGGAVASHFCDQLSVFRDNLREKGAGSA